MVNMGIRITFSKDLFQDNLKWFYYRIQVSIIAINLQKGFDFTLFEKF